MSNPKNKVLIIEDEKLLLELLSKKLRSEGYDVFTAEDGESGLKQVLSVAPDLILLDIVMPKMDGYEVLNALQGKFGLGKMPLVIIISNSGQPVEIDRAKEMGARDFIIKAQFTPEEVSKKVKKLLGTAERKAGLTENAAPENIPAAAPRREAKNAEAKILVVEDDQFLADLLKTKLERENFSVISAMDGPSGADKIIKERPEVVLLDIILPGIDGFEVLKRVRTNANMQIAETPIILLSNLGQETDIERGRALGADDYLIKSNFTIDEIIEKIRNIMEIKK